MWALDYKGPNHYSFVQGGFDDLVQTFPEKCLFSSEEEADKYGRIYSEVDQDLRTVYAIACDEENRKAEIISGTKSELVAQGFDPDNILLWEEEAQLHKKSLERKMNPIRSVRMLWGLDYRGPGDYSIESGDRSVIREKYPAKRRFDLQDEAEEYARLLSDVDRDLVTIYKVVHNREHGTSEIVSGTKSELIAMGHTEPFCYTEEAAQRTKRGFEINMNLRNKQKKKDC